MECVSGLCRLSGDLSLLWGVWTSSIIAALEALHRISPLIFPMVCAFLGVPVAVLAASLAEALPRRRGWEGWAADERYPLLAPSPACNECRDDPVYVASIAYVLRSGRCRACDAPMALDRLFLEAGVMIGSGIVAAVFGPTLFALGLLLLFWWCAVIGWFDWRTQEIPDVMTFPLLFLGALITPFDVDILSRVMGAGFAAGFLIAIFTFVSKMKEMDAQSYGDVAFCAALGAWLGVCGVLPFILVSMAVYGAYAFRYWRRGADFVAMGPALAAGGVLTAATGLSL